MSRSLKVFSAMDSGNAELVSIDEESVLLNIRKDSKSEFLQWFHFLATGLKGRLCKFVIDNASETTYPKGWEGYSVATSSDRQCWTRTPAHYDGKRLSWSVNTEQDQIWFAYFAPYSMEQHADLVARAAASPGVSHCALGTTHLGRAIDYLSLITEDRADEQKAQLWIIARQHPGESMAEWFIQGLIDRLLDEDDASSCALRKLADIHLIPNMNPDGSFIGNLRTNALGVNLNREWARPSANKSPEVFYVLEKMKQTGVSMMLDVHGDEALPYNFIAGTEGIDGWSPERNQQLVDVKHTWASLNPDFQYRHGYPINRPGTANMSICSNQIAERFNCLAMTLEMPFKDTADNPKPAVGWSAERSIKLGASFVDIARLTLTKRLLTAL